MTAPARSAAVLADHSGEDALLDKALAREDDPRFAPGTPAQAAWRRHLARRNMTILPLARRCARGFDMRVLAYDPVPDRHYAEAHGIELVALETLLATADFVSPHIPQSPQTDGFIDAAKLRLMPPRAFLINTARGSLVDVTALYDALRERRIAGAGLDVFRHKPPTGSPLLGLPNVVLTPHLTGMDDTGELAMAGRRVDAILAMARGESPGSDYVLNPSAFAAPART